MTCATEFRWSSAAATDVGRVRGRNEDACLDLPERGIWAVADGMGGHAVGDFASRAIVQALSGLGPPGSLDGALDDARTALLAVNQALIDEAARMKVRVIGSTVVAMLACERRCGCLWAGDSRLYLFRAGHLKQLTRDHSQVERLRARGLITAEEAKHHPAHNTITRAVGAATRLDLDVLTLEVGDGDMFLLCSDGLSNEVEDAGIAAVLAASAGDCAAAANELVQQALVNGGHDNVSVVVLRAEDIGGGSDMTLLNPEV
ncbi:Serine/threonine phosphatase stp [compost metagenome]|uniref:Protein phosphatase 2C domain-containing protein n=3 Tax=Cupriavidus campinensis TaxID=151783 RepID=A0AAE9HW62_9BURK|nr:MULTISPECIES: protein phosphatase 2C domain-containing protein [Cupriavidus]TSP11480.1 serine/threonine-protein phosphatase [Cupriavidus campinensis]URF03227.1 protein phosphatase 2C domain-containing protein [Cupriavidus campinensis]CAG2145626.1 Protein phosphatase PrpC [Cupriavidus campinensis]